MNFHVPTPESVQARLGLSEPPEYIDKGGFKAVYRMRTENGYEAIKAVHVPPVQGDDDSFRSQLVARAEREIEALGHCQSPTLVKLGSLKPVLCEIDGHEFLVYGEEFVDGQPLTNWIKEDKRPSFDKLIGVFTALVELIKELSSNGFLHRDIKPANILETNDPNRPFVVLDLGIAFKMHGTELTQGGTPPGTLLFMAPELLKPDYKDVMDFRCDLYAAGLTLYVLAAGIHPFAHKPENQYATAYRIVNQKPEPLTRLRPDLPSVFCGIIDRCIRKKLALRYASIGLVKNALQEFGE